MTTMERLPLPPGILEHDVPPPPPAAQAQRAEDLWLAERIHLALHATGYGVLRTIRVSVHARTVQLAGRVPSYYLKQIAQETVLAVPGTHQLHNGLKVVPPR